MFYSVDRSGIYQTGGTLDLWQQDPLLGRPFWRLPRATRPVSTPIRRTRSGCCARVGRPLYQGSDADRSDSG